MSPWPPDKQGLPEIREGNLVIAWRKEAIRIEGGNRCHVYRSATHDTLDYLDTYVKITYYGMKRCLYIVHQHRKRLSVGVQADFLRNRC